MFVGEARSLKGASFKLSLILFANIRLGWKDLQGPNTLAYYEPSQIVTVKRSITLGRCSLAILLSVV